MKTLWRNKRTFSYCLYERDEPILDEYYNDSGERRIIYSEPAEMKANISPATGAAQVEQFGNLENYDKVIVTDWLDCPIDENSVLFIDKPVTYRAIDGTETTEVTDTPLYDYIVRRVAKSLNSVSIAVSKVKVS